MQQCSFCQERQEKDEKRKKTYATFLTDAPTEAACILLPELRTEELLCPQEAKLVQEGNSWKISLAEGRLSSAPSLGHCSST